MNKATADLVRQRAAGRCEYCGVIEALFRFKFHLEHVIARQHGGNNTADNLALACAFCNSHKGPNLSGIDPLNGALTRLFHPRQDRWHDHFRSHGLLIEGITEMGRATISVLSMNHPTQMTLRQAMLNEDTPVSPA